MEEYNFNSQSSYSDSGERNSHEPITVAFKQEPTKTKRKRSGKRTAWLAVVSIILIIGLATASGIIGALLFKEIIFDNFTFEYSTQVITGNEDKEASSSTDAQVTLDLKSDLLPQPETSSIPSVPATNATYASVAAAAKPTVVEITTEMAATNSYFQQFIQSGAGSGVIISQDGYIITNHHVIYGASKIIVRMDDGKEFTAALKGSDAQADIAILKIETEAPLPYAKIGNSDTLVVGEEVLAIGNPLGSLGGTVTNGIISALDREITVDGQKMRLLQTNAAINPGNSGGGLFNMRGELVAVVNAKSSGTGIEGLGFAIPINYAYKVANELLEKGYVGGRPIIGISYIAIDDFMDLMRYGVDVYGIYVYDGGNTELKNGDRIVRIGDYEVQSVASLKSAIQHYNVGDTVKITVVREGKFTDIDATLIEDVPTEKSQLELSVE